jgi:hypothetical protein
MDDLNVLQYYDVVTPPFFATSLESYKLPKSLVTFPLCDSSIKQGEDSLDG